MSNERITREQLATVFNLIAHFKWDDLIFTHASARIPGTNRILLNRYGLGFNEITADNLVSVDLHDDTDPALASIAGLILHKELYKSRPDINCAIHTHTPAGIAVSADSRGLLPISQHSLIVYNTISYYEYQGIFVDENEPEHIITQLKTNKCMFLRNHGLLTVGASVQEAFVLMYHLQKACEIQTLTDLDHASYISEEVIRDFPEKLAKFKESNTKDVLWKMLTRLVKSVHKNY